MKKTFIERLWEKEPKLVKTKVASICTFREDEARFFTMIGTAKLNGNIGIVFREKGMGRAKDIFVGDFEINYLTDAEFNSEDKTAEWLKFMHGIFGEEYVSEYIDNRNYGLDRFMANYEKRYNEQTIKVVQMLQGENVKLSK